MVQHSSSALNEALDAISDGWCMSRVLREHMYSTTARQESEVLSDREFLVVKLVQKFPNLVTQKLIRIIFATHFGQTGEIVNSLQKLGILRKTGRGKPLELTTNGARVIEKLQRIKMSEFSATWGDLNDEDLRALARIMQKVDKTATRMIEERIVGKETTIKKLLAT